MEQQAWVARAYGNHWALWEIARMWIGMVGFSALVIWAVYALVNSGIWRDGAYHRDSAGQLLDQRLARSDIDANEYHRPRDLLSSHDTHPVDVGNPQ
jgi:uncharacterized membrane protein